MSQRFEKAKRYTDLNMKNWKTRLEKIPTSDVAPVIHGCWIPIAESEITGFNPEFTGCDPIGGYQCSNCKGEAILDCNDEFVLSDYCYNCGAKMDLGDDENA